MYYTSTICFNKQYLYTVHCIPPTTIANFTSVIETYANIKFLESSRV